MAHDFRYCPYYCEENVWQLCADPEADAPDKRVLIISNPGRKVAMWGQKASRNPASPIAWDYHVILLTRQPGEPWLAWDLDTRGPSPRPLRDWLDYSFREIGMVPPEFAPRFRMVEARDYRRHFRSDRRHMRHTDGMPRQPPPSWPAIMGEPVPGFTDDGSNLDRFLDTEDPRFLGELFDLRGLRRWLEAEPRARA